MLPFMSVAMDLSSQKESEENEEHLASKRAGQTCPICEVGKIVPESTEKASITVYGRDGTRVVKSTNHRCLFKAYFGA